MSASCRPANKAPRSDHNDQLFWNPGCGFRQQVLDFVEFVGTVMDVTERRRAEEERQALAHANRITTMGQLTASIAHEVNQPIAA
jgi:signal transduction histidine kinase